MVPSEGTRTGFWYHAMLTIHVAFFFGFSTAAVVPARNNGGCGLPHDFIGTTKQFNINSSNLLRDYRIHLPNSYNPKIATPLIMSYHGATETAEFHEDQTQLSNEDYNANMITVYPQGVHNHWEGPSYATPNVSDKNFTTDLLNHLKSNYCIDADRIYASGKSNGGGFVGLLACSPDHGGDFAAFAAVSGAFYRQLPGDSCARARHTPTPILEIHGGADKTANYNGKVNGNGGPLPAIPDWLSGWAVRDGCPSSPRNTTQDSENDQVHHVTYSCGDAINIVDHWKVDPMGHKWPRAATNDLVDATQLLMEFFNATTRTQGHRLLSVDHAGL